MSKLTEYLNNLEILDLIARQKSDPELEYAFKHVFTQESVYGSLLYSDRRQIHQQVGEALEAALANNVRDDEKWDQNGIGKCRFHNPCPFSTNFLLVGSHFATRPAKLFGLDDFHDDSISLSNSQG